MPGSRVTVPLPKTMRSSPARDSRLSSSAREGTRGCSPVKSQASIIGATVTANAPSVRVEYSTAVWSRLYSSSSTATGEPALSLSADTALALSWRESRASNRYSSASASFRACAEPLPWTVRSITVSMAKIWALASLL